LDRSISIIISGADQVRTHLLTFDFDFVHESGTSDSFEPSDIISRIEHVNALHENSPADNVQPWETSLEELLELEDYFPVSIWNPSCDKPMPNFVAVAELSQSLFLSITIPYHS
jgi:hypothetical protein